MDPSLRTRGPREGREFAVVAPLARNGVYHFRSEKLQVRQRCLAHVSFFPRVVMALSGPYLQVSVEGFRVVYKHDGHQEYDRTRETCFWRVTKLMREILDTRTPYELCQKFKKYTPPRSLGQDLIGFSLVVTWCWRVFRRDPNLTFPLFF